MPLTKSGKTILTKMESEYGKEKGKSVFYAMMNKKPKATEKWHKKQGG